MKRILNVPKAEPTTLDWARLAAFVDGEGCMNIKDSKYTTKAGGERNYHVLTLSVFNSGIGLMRWLQDTFGGKFWLSHGRQTRPAHWHDCWKWSLDSARAEHAIRNIMPFLLVKHEQAEVALALRATVSKRGFNVVRDKQGHILGHVDVDHVVLDKRAALKAKMIAINSRRGSAAVNE